MELDTCQLDAAVLAIDSLLAECGYTYVCLLDTEQAERGGEEFLSPELGIASALSASYQRKIEPLLSAIDKGSSLDKALREVTRAAGSVVSDWEHDRITNLIGDALDIGAAQFGVIKADKRTRAKPTLSKVGIDTLRNGLAKHVRYYGNGYFKKTVLPRIEKAITQSLRDAKKGRASMAKIREAIAGKEGHNAYWRLVANVAASRAYHFGLVTKAAELGYNYLRIKAVLDERTSKLCRHLNGKIVPVQECLEQAMAIATAKPEDAKELSPWLDVDDVKGKDLSSLGVLLPPYHANCRSVVVPVARRKS